MKDKNLKQILKKANEIIGCAVDIPDMSGKIKRIASSASFPENIIRRNNMETNRNTKRTKLWAWLVPVTACLVAGIICAAVILPGLLGGNNDGLNVNITLSAPENRYLANSYKSEDDRIKYSYSYNDDEGNQYDFYYIYLGKLHNIPLCYKGQMFHTGQNRTYSFTTTKENMENIGESIARGSSEAISTVKENTVVTGTTRTLSTEIGITVGFEAGAFGGKLSVEGSVKRTAEDAFKEEFSSTTSNSFEKTTSLENTVSRATSFSQGEQETYEYSLTREDPNGYYRLSLFSVSDVYLYVIKEADTADEKGKLVYYEFEEHLIPNSLTWGLDYSKDFFEKENNSRFELGMEILNDLPEPKVHLGGGVKVPGYANEIESKISITDKLICSVTKKGENSPVTSLPNLTSVKIEVLKGTDVIKTLSYSKPTNFEFDLSEFIFEKNLIIHSTLYFNQDGKEFDVSLAASYSCNVKTNLDEINDSREEAIFIDLTGQTIQNKTIKIQAEVKSIFIKGDPAKTYTGISFEVLTRTNPISLNFNNFSFISPNSTTAINALGCDLDLNITGSCRITGGAGSRIAPVASGDAGGIGIIAKNLKIKGTGTLNITGGDGGAGNGTTSYPGGYNYNSGGNGGKGIYCDYLITDIQTIVVTGGQGGSGASGGGRGGDGGHGIECISLENKNPIAIVAIGGKGGSGGAGASSGIDGAKIKYR